MTGFTVLGATGFVGSHLVRHLKAAGRAVRTPGRGADLSGAGLGHVVYCIGMTADYLKHPIATVRAHVCVLTALLETARFDSLTYLSSTRLYDSGGADAREANDLILNPATPRHLFDLTKGAGEALCLAVDHPNVRVARLSSVYADDLSSDNFVHQVVHRSLRERELTLDTAPGYERDYIHSDDVCAVLTDIAVSGRRPIYNVASGVNVTNRDLFQWIERDTGCRIRMTGDAASVASPRIDVAAIREDFGHEPTQLSRNIGRLIAANADTVPVAASVPAAASEEVP